MSVPNSLFAKIKIKKDKFTEFLQSKPDQPKLDKNWLDWWNSKEMYGKSELTQTQIYGYDDPTNADIINGWTNAKQSFTFSDYDAENEIWNFGIIMFSENYLEMIPGLSFIKSVASFKDDNSDDFAIIYNYFWGSNDINAYVEFKDNESFFDIKTKEKSDILPKILEYTENYLSKKWDEFADNGATDEYD